MKFNLTVNEQHKDGFKDKLIGKRFGKLILCQEVSPQVYESGRKRRFLCRCDCGNDKGIKCIFFNEASHIDNWAGVSKDGMFCNNSVCLINLAKGVEK